MSQFDFSELTPDLILDAIESIGVYPESGLLPLNSYENRVYQFVAEDKQRYVAKFYRPERWTNEQILEEHQYSLELAEQDIGVVAPLNFNGNTLFHFNGYRFCLFPSVGGRMFELDNLDQLEWLGRLLGRMHQVARQQPFKHRTQINVADELALARDIIADSSMVPMHLTSTFFHDLDMLIAKTLPLSQVNAESIRLHGDCHSGNILLTYKEGEEEATLVDLDDCLTGPAIQDIWMMLSGDRQQQMLQLDTIVSAYEEFSDFDRAELALIEPLRTRRMINYMAWIALRWQDPAFPRNFSWFATDKYWEQQILAIKEQLAALDDAPLRLGL